MKIKSLSNLADYIKSDSYRYVGGGNLLTVSKLYLTVIGFRYLCWMRICCYLKSRKLLFPLYLISKLRLEHIAHNSGIQIGETTQIGRGFYIGHYGTIVVSSSAVLGKNVNISQGVTIGRANRGEKAGTAVIGDEVYIGPGAKIVGAVRIGNNVAIGANAVVTHDVPDNACVAGVPAKIISMDGAAGYVNRKV